MSAAEAAERFCNRFEITVPIVNAPMASIAGGRLAAAVAGSGGLGLVGGGYGDEAWIDEQLALAGKTVVGVGLIAWAVAHRAYVLDDLVDRGVRTVFLSFGDIADIAPRLRRAGVRVICQVQSIEGATRACDAGADAIVAQGSESGGHGRDVAGLAELLPGVVSVVGQVPVLAAGAITSAGDVRRVCALGAAGVVVGTRFYATYEALDSDGAKQRLVERSETVRTSVFDVLRGPQWPTGFDGRALVNQSTVEWEANEAEVRRDVGERRAGYARAVRFDDLDHRVVWAGSGVSRVTSIESTADVFAELADGFL